MSENQGVKRDFISDPKLSLLLLHFKILILIFLFTDRSNKKFKLEKTEKHEKYYAKYT